MFMLDAKHRTNSQTPVNEASNTKDNALMATSNWTEQSCQWQMIIRHFNKYSLFPCVVPLSQTSS